MARPRHCLGRRSTRKFDARYCLIGIGLARVEENLDWAMEFGRAIGSRWPGYEDDCVQAACEGLIYAAAKFDESRGQEFRAYAAPWVKGECVRTLRFTTRLMTPYRGTPANPLPDRPAVVSIHGYGRYRLNTWVGVKAVAPDTGRVDDRDEAEALLACLPDDQAEVVRGYFYGDVGLDVMSYERGYVRSWGVHKKAQAVRRMRARAAEMGCEIAAL